MVLFHKMLLGFFIFKNLLDYCGFKIAVAEFVYPIFLKETISSFGSYCIFSVSIQLEIMSESMTNLAIKALASTIKYEVFYSLLNLSLKDLF